jgi:hypothetical protein
VLWCRSTRPLRLSPWLIRLRRRLGSDDSNPAGLVAHLPKGQSPPYNQPSPYLYSLRIILRSKLLSDRSVCRKISAQWLLCVSQLARRINVPQPVRSQIRCDFWRPCLYDTRPSSHAEQRARAHSEAACSRSLHISICVASISVHAFGGWRLSADTAVVAADNTSKTRFSGLSDNMEVGYSKFIVPVADVVTYSRVTRPPSPLPSPHGYSDGFVKAGAP